MATNNRFSPYLTHILDALLSARKGEPPPPIEIDDFSLQTLVEALRANVVTMRYWEAMGESGDPNLKDFPMRHIERGRKHLSVCYEMAGLVNDVFEKAQKKVMVVKTFDNPPDLGHDLDLFTDLGPKETDEIILGNFDAKITERTLSEVLANKRNYDVPGKVVLEIHCGRLGQVGEDEVLCRELIARRVKVEKGGFDAYAPKLEHAVVLRTMQRMYRHFRIRLADVINTIREGERDDYDWAYLREFTERAGLYRGVVYFVNYVRSVARQSGYDFTIPTEFYRGPSFERNHELPVFSRGMHYRFSRGTVPAKLYLSKMATNLKALNAPAVARTSLVFPLAAMRMVVFKVVGKDIVW
jgi:hypothetical protein